MDTPSRVALYLRISQDRSGEALGVARQRKRCEQLAAARGWTIVGVYEDELRLTKKDGDYINVYVLPNESTDSIRLSVRTDSDIGQEIASTTPGTQVALRLTPPRIATSRRAGNRYLAGLQVLEFFTD